MYVSFPSPDTVVEKTRASFPVTSRLLLEKKQEVKGRLADK